MTTHITPGANTGVGFETATALLESSPKYHVILGSRSLEKGQKAVEALKSEFPAGSVSLLQLDITDAKSIAAAVQAVEKGFGRLDVLINNAGIVSHATPLLSQLREVFETNTFGPAVVTEAFLSLLRKSSNPRLIYVTSSLGSIELRGDKSRPSYSRGGATYRMSKAALDMLAACHHVELGETIKVFAFDPGLVATNLGGFGPEALRQRGAGSPETSAQALLSIVEGARDADVGKLVHKDGIHPW